MNYLPENDKRNAWLENEERSKSQAMKTIGMLYEFLRDDMKGVNTVLDIGTGRGHFVNLMNYFGKKCIGIDKRTEFEDDPFKTMSNPFLVADMNTLPFKDNTFNMVHEYMALSDIKYFQDGNEDSYVPVLEEIHRVIKPDGYYIGQMHKSFLKNRKFQTLGFSHHDFWVFRKNLI